MKKVSTLLLTAAGAIAAIMATPAAAAPKAVLTHETLWMMKRVGAPVVSPDGKWVVYSLNEPNYEADKAMTDLWLVPVDGSAAPRRLTSSKAGESGPAWAPDSRRIAFSAKREGDDDAQIYILDLAGGEAQRVTSLPFAVSAPQWRPDGKAILFEAMAWPGAMDAEANKKAAAEKKARKFNMRVYEHFPIRYWNDWIDERRPTLWVQSLEPGAKAVDILSSTKLGQTEGFGGNAQSDGGNTLNPVWSPDGKEIVFTATTQRWQAARARVNFNLYRMPATGGEPKLATPTEGEYGDLKFSPDGKSLLFKFNTQGNEIYDLARLNRVAWPAGGAATVLTPGFDREIDQYAVTPDSSTIYAIVPDAGAENLYSLPAAGGTPAVVIAPKVGGYTSLDIPSDAASTILVGSYGSAVNPAEIVRIDPVAKRHANLTNVNTALAASIDWSSPEHFWFTAKDGLKIHNMIVTPPNFDPKKKYPLFVLIHGGPASTNPDQIGLRWNYHLLASAGYVVLLTDYKGSTGYGEAFSRAINLDPLRGPANEIDEAVDEAARLYPFIDVKNACAGGASYGGHLTNWIEATTTRYKCLVSHAGEVDLLTQWGTSDFAYGRELSSGGAPWGDSKIWRDQSPISYGDQWKTPMLLTAGEKDYRVPLPNTLETWVTLQRQQVPSRLLIFPDAWHWITKPEDSRQFYREVQGWLAHYLKGAPAVTGGPIPAPEAKKGE
ncbi:S9 family peptidase [Sphingomonas crocodyli]|uniref:S9 family peptidase n=1 Tax=Sphingomonas crocodyli TaxID=1979270 RepID=A0A437LWP2_9SPHN|nr:S9 family peptidase [Sphingomonas crocodyli]RVT89821.1 S9 family peptidase [Sphingomonas crocodyli]